MDTHHNGIIGLSDADSAISSFPHQKSNVVIKMEGCDPAVLKDDHDPNHPKVQIGGV
jgi:hypothetical protein